MTDITTPIGVQPRLSGVHTDDAAKARLRGRYAAEARFKWIGAGAVALSALFLVLLLSTIVTEALPAFRMNYLTLPVDLSAAKVDPANPGATNFAALAQDALSAKFPGVESRQDRRLLRGLISTGAGDILRRQIAEDPSLLGKTVDYAVSARRFRRPLPEGTDRREEFGHRDYDDGDALRHQRRHRRDVRRRQRCTACARLWRDRGERCPAPDQRRVFPARPGRRRHGQADRDFGRRRRSTVAKGTVVKPLDGNAAAASGAATLRVIDTPESSRKISDKEIVWLDELKAQSLVESRFNSIFFFTGASREPELAGIWGAVVGSFLTMIVTLAIAFPIGVSAAIYLEEFAPKNRLTTIIEVNINNLAAVPSIVYGLLGLAVFLNFFGLPRSAPLVGGMVLALMTLPIIIIASRASLRAVPPSIREAALGIGASKVQTVFHHVLPLAMPGIMTGTILGMAHALGETAPLLMIGMVAFIVDIPGGFTDPATILPVQIFMWADFPEAGFQQKTSAAILILLAFLVIMNAIAVILRKRFERRW